MAQTHRDRRRLLTSQVEAYGLVLVTHGRADVVVVAPCRDVGALLTICCQDALHGSATEVQQPAEILLGQKGVLLEGLEAEAADTARGDAAG